MNGKIVQLTVKWNNEYSIKQQHKFTIYHDGKGYWFVAMSGEIFSTNILFLKRIFAWISTKYVNMFAYKWVKSGFS